MARLAPIRYLDQQVYLAMPNPTTRRVVGAVFLVLGGLVLAADTLVGMIVLVIAAIGPLVLCVAFACLGGLFLGLGIAAVRVRPDAPVWDQMPEPSVSSGP